MLSNPLVTAMVQKGGCCHMREEWQTFLFPTPVLGMSVWSVEDKGRERKERHVCKLCHYSFIIHMQAERHSEIRGLVHAHACTNA